MRFPQWADEWVDFGGGFDAGPPVVERPPRPLIAEGVRMAVYCIRCDGHRCENCPIRLAKEQDNQRRYGSAATRCRTRRLSERIRNCFKGRDSTNADPHD